MILGIEIGLTILGIYTLFKKKWPMGKRGYLVGRQAKILGILSVITLPVVFLFSFVVATIIGIIKGPTVLISSPWIGIGIEFVAVVFWAGLLLILNSKFGRTGKIIGKNEVLP